MIQSVRYSPPSFSNQSTATCAFQECSFLVQLLSFVCVFSEYKIVAFRLCSLKASFTTIVEQDYIENLLFFFFLVLGQSSQQLGLVCQVYKLRFKELQLVDWIGFQLNHKNRKFTLTRLKILHHLEIIQLLEIRGQHEVYDLIQVHYNQLDLVKQIVSLLRVGQGRDRSKISTWPFFLTINTSRTSLQDYNKFAFFLFYNLFNLMSNLVCKKNVIFICSMKILTKLCQNLILTFYSQQSSMKCSSKQIMILSTSFDIFMFKIYIWCIRFVFCMQDVRIFKTGVECIIGGKAEFVHGASLYHYGLYELITTSSAYQLVIWGKGGQLTGNFQLKILLVIFSKQFYTLSVCCLFIARSFEWLLGLQFEC
eukprot:TRINITY_DN5054_c0_g1_i3.p1 TRINITY_DN5054_c0_g1~~TRINITY_DN5054_c0_g1_i3.p1  ORF type:complete len:366 (+),score=-17.31 TRINITY_DN5054_c0_g1_i3:175-1272(+)